MDKIACCSLWKKCSETGKCVNKEIYPCYLKDNLEKGFNPFKTEEVRQQKTPRINEKNAEEKNKIPYQKEITLLDFM